MEKIKDELKKILADDAYNSGDMQVSNRVSKLVKSVNYLVTQLNFTKDFVEPERKSEIFEHIDKVISNVKQMLNT